MTFNERRVSVNFLFRYFFRALTYSFNKGDKNFIYFANSIINARRNIFFLYIFCLLIP